MPKRHPAKRAWNKFVRYLNLPYDLATTIVSGPKPTIVLLHGIGAHSATWNNTINDLRGKYRIVAIDLLGHGASPAPNNIKYTARDHARSVRWTLWRSHIRGRVIMVGYSLGAIVAADFAAHYPYKVKHLILASLPLYEDPHMSQTRRDQWAKIIRDLHTESFRYLRTKPRLVKGYAKFTEKLFGRSPIGFRIDDQTWEPFALSLKNTIERQKVLDDFKHIRKPVDMIYGIHDQVIITDYVNDLAKGYRNVRLHTFGGNHEMSRAYSDRLADLIRNVSTPSSKKY
jgi:pimeloyl-ACP methyl ester carboxylesterase